MSPVAGAHANPPQGSGVAAVAVQVLGEGHVLAAGAGSQRKFVPVQYVAPTTHAAPVVTPPQKPWGTPPGPTYCLPAPKTQLALAVVVSQLRELQNGLVPKPLSAEAETVKEERPMSDAKTLAVAAVSSRRKACQSFAGCPAVTPCAALMQDASVFEQLF